MNTVRKLAKIISSSLSYKCEEEIIDSISLFFQYTPNLLQCVCDVSNDDFSICQLDNALSKINEFSEHRKIKGVYYTPADVATLVKNYF